ncbi:hypothetical protein [Agrococcus casei]|uniref:hypothetical protein n=1 Tax=Agrococcus casei TaxID=343512 RepID=UPI003F8E4FEF
MLHPTINFCHELRCTLSVADHIDRMRRFVDEYQRLPRQRPTAPELMPDEWHLGGYLRYARQRDRCGNAHGMDPLILGEVRRLAQAVPPRHALSRYRSSRGRSVEEMIAIVAEFAEREDRLPRLFGIEEPREKLAGQVLNTLRCIDRGTRRSERRVMTDEHRELLRQLVHEDWRGNNAGQPYREVPRYHAA